MTCNCWDVVNRGMQYPVSCSLHRSVASYRRLLLPRFAKLREKQRGKILYLCRTGSADCAVGAVVDTEPRERRLPWSVTARVTRRWVARCHCSCVVGGGSVAWKLLGGGVLHMSGSSSPQGVAANISHTALQPTALTPLLTVSAADWWDCSRGRNVKAEGHC